MNTVHVEIFKFGHLKLEQEVEEGATVKDLLYKLAMCHNDVIELAFDFESQKLTGMMGIVLNGTFIQLLDELNTKLTNGDSVVLLPAIDGG